MDEFNVELDVVPEGFMEMQQVVFGKDDTITLLVELTPSDSALTLKLGGHTPLEHLEALEMLGIILSGLTEDGEEANG